MGEQSGLGKKLFDINIGVHEDLGLSIGINGTEEDFQINADELIGILERARVQLAMINIEAVKSACDDLSK
jgi:hypothetical protein